MGGTPSMLYSGAMEAAGGMIVSGAVSSFKRKYEMQETTAGTVESSAVSSITSGYEMQEGLDLTLYSLQHEVSKIKSAIGEAIGRRITNQMLLQWLAQIIDAAYIGEYYHRTFENQNSLPPMIASTQGTSNLLIDPISRPAKWQRTNKTSLFGKGKHRELNDVLQKLKSIDICAFLQMVHAQPERPMKRYIYVDHIWLIRRDKERGQVLKFLCKPNMADENNVDILPIAFSDGVEKTTLALHCIHDPKVQNHFSLKIYISEPDLSDPYSCGPRVIFKQILKRLNNTGITNGDENVQLVIVKQNLSSERLLLEMDSILGVDSTVWNALLSCVTCAKQGSKVIIFGNIVNLLSS